MGLKPDVISFTAAISACGSGGSAEDAVAIFREMDGAGVPPNVITHNSVMAACVTAGRWEKALELFLEVLDDAKSGSIGGDACSFNTALSACEVRFNSVGPVWGGGGYGSGSRGDGGGWGVVSGRWGIGWWGGGGWGAVHQMAGRGGILLSAVSNRNILLDRISCKVVETRTRYLACTMQYVFSCHIFFISME